MKPDLTLYLGRTVSVTVDRQLGSRHPRYPDLQYSVNYGFLPGTVSGDGMAIDVYLLGFEEAVVEADAVVIAVVVRADDAEDKLVAAPAGWSCTLAQISDAVAFQERYFDSTVMLLSAEDADAVAVWQLGAVLSAVVPATGTVNRTLLLGFSAGPRVLRVSTRERERTAGEHRCIQFAADHGLPVCRPVTHAGGTIFERGGSCYALFPVASGLQIVREKLRPEHAWAAGECLARIHAVFEAFPKEQARVKRLLGGLMEAPAVIANAEAAIEALPMQTETEWEARAHLTKRRLYLAQNRQDTSGIAERLAALPQRMLHGDYQETNLFFEGSQVSAVIDWDQSGLGPRGWEIIRALHLLCSLKPKLCAAFLGGYESVTALGTGELEESAACYGVLADRNLWVYAAAYLEGNARAKQFITPGPFVPFAEQWEEAAKKAGS